MPGAIFSDYAAIYDAIYAAKDYREEAEFVVAQLQGAGPRPNTLLEIGSGTGRHLEHFAKDGITVVGVDLSHEMTELARARLAGSAITGCEVRAGDIRALNLGRRFAAAASLFHVISYLTSPKDLSDGFASVRRHLETGAQFLFDFWHLPGVRLDPPALRTREFSTPSGTIRRCMRPEWRDPITTLDIEISGEYKNRPITVREQHRLRAWDPNELELALNAAGFSIERWGAGLGPKPLCAQDWLGWALARAR